MSANLTRREWLAAAGGACLAQPVRSRASAGAPGGIVSVARCRNYGSELLPSMQRMFDQIGGLGRLVKGKTVVMKVNLTGSPSYRLGFKPAGDTHYTHPSVIAATAHLMGRAGAKRIRVVECPWNTADPLEEVMLEANWEPRQILNAAPHVEFENTNYLGPFRKTYSRFKVPKGGHMFKEYVLNGAYEECDVFVSIAKMKDHATAGITLAMKNCFGITPCTIYGDRSPVDEPSPVPRGGRGPFHAGNRQPAKIAPPENDPASPRQAGYRVPRVVADLAAARPIHLSIVEAVESMAGGEGPWIRGSAPVSPQVIVAGTNPVATDVVCMQVMGYDPMADRGTPPFERCDSTLRLAEELGVGTRDLNRIEVVGTPVKEAMVFNFAEFRKKRGANWAR
ncbi:MAG: DUF362 domain-containing protein [Bryobacterales bacterium]|nr:DUF362 domain-containing protein [Bryobacterales bacterium]